MKTTRLSFFGILSAVLAAVIQVGCTPILNGDQSQGLGGASEAFSLLGPGGLDPKEGAEYRPFNAWLRQMGFHFEYFGADQFVQKITLERLGPGLHSGGFSGGSLTRTQDQAGKNSMTLNPPESVSLPGSSSGTGEVSNESDPNYINWDNVDRIQFKIRVEHSRFENNGYGVTKAVEVKLGEMAEVDSSEAVPPNCKQENTPEGEQLSNCKFSVTYYDAYVGKLTGDGTVEYTPFDIEASALLEITVYTRGGERASEPLPVVAPLID